MQAIGSVPRPRAGASRDDAEARALADEALRLVGADPHLADDHGARAVLLAQAAGDRVTESRALRARGLAAKTLQRPGEGEALLRRSVLIADRAGAAEVAAEARMSLALPLTDRGRMV